MPGKKGLQLYLNSGGYPSTFFYAKNSACRPQGFTREVLNLPCCHSEKATGSLHTTAMHLVASAFRRRKLRPSQWLRRALRVVAVTNAVLAVGVCVLGFVAISSEEQDTKDVLKVGVGFISAGQLGLLVLYSGLWRRWKESIKQELSFSTGPIEPLKRSNLWTALERFLYTIIPIPGVNYHWSLGRDFVLSLDCVLYSVTLLRCYFVLWALFWLSDLSTRRVQLLAKVFNVWIWPKFGLRYCFHLHYLAFIGVFSALAVMLCGVLLAVFDPQSSLLGIALGNSLWLAASAESTTGYSDVLPQTVLSRILILLTWLTGCCSLFLLPGLLGRQLTMSRAQGRLYAELAFAQYKRNSRETAVQRIQSWWRLLAMRRQQVLSAETIVKACRQQAKYRRFLLFGGTLKDRGLDGQMEAFQNSVCSKLQTINANFQVILSMQVMVLAYTDHEGAASAVRHHAPSQGPCPPLPPPQRQAPPLHFAPTPAGVPGKANTAPRSTVDRHG